MLRQCICQYGDSQSDIQEEQHDRSNAFPDFSVPSRTCKLSDQDSSTRGEAGDRIEEHIDHMAGIADCGYVGDVGRIQADNNHVRRRVGCLKQVGNEKRAGKAQQRFQNRAA